MNNPNAMKSLPDYKLALKAVHNLLNENSIIEPPISPKEIAQNCGLEVLFASFPGPISEVMGFCNFENKKIFVNSANPVNRQTFTIAHELGHYILHKSIIEADPTHYKVLLRKPMGAFKDPLEQEANSFAANLLVPRKFLDKYYKIASISELATLFIVSEEVIRFRLKLEYGL